MTTESVSGTSLPWEERTAIGTPGGTQIATGSVAIVGLGYVGWPLAELARKRRFEVLGIDINPRRRQQLAENNPLGVDLQSSFANIGEADTVIICVPTPVRDGHIPTWNR